MTIGFFFFLNRSGNKVPKKLVFNGVSSPNEQKTADLFPKYFSSVFFNKQIDPDISKLGISSFDLPNNIHLTKL